jgi:hypothetical protein
MISSRGYWQLEPRSYAALKSQIGLIGGILNAYGRFGANDTRGVQSIS